MEKIIFGFSFASKVDDIHYMIRNDRSLHYNIGREIEIEQLLLEYNTC